MFSSLRLRNFKSHVDTRRVSLRPLTIIVGPNNSGKSSLLDSILLLTQTLDDQVGREPLVTAGALVDLGGYRDLVFGGSATREVGIELRLQDDYHDLMSPPFNPRDRRPTELRVSFRLDRESKAIAVARQTYADAEGVVFDKRHVKNGWRFSGRDAAVVRRMPAADFHFLPGVSLPERAPSPKLREKMVELYVRSQDSVYMWRAVFSNVRYMVPLRQPIPRFSLLGKTVTAELGAGGENLLRVLQDPEPLAETGRTLLEEVNHWMADRFKMLGRLTIDELGESIRSLLSTEGRMHLNVANMGEGIAQLLPIVVSTVSLEPRAALLVEQPELHLHPAAQANLGDLFAEALAAQPSRQFLVETHSEHLLLRIRRHIASGLIRHEDVLVLYVDKTEGRSRITPLELTELGNFETWPKGFFAEAYNESLELAREATKRKRSSA